MGTDSPKGIFTISLDFEMHWGVRDHWSVNDYRANLEGERDAVKALLEIFRAYDIHATWACVGFLFFKTKQDLLNQVPERKPEYVKTSLSPYPALMTLGESESVDPLHFAPSLIQAIQDTPGQEIGSHTFSHYFCLEQGQDVQAFREDLRAAVAVAQERGIVFHSFVFPRNQFNQAYLEVCREMGIVAYRGNERSWIYEPKNEEQETSFRRAVRLLDAYVPLSGHHTYALHALPKTIPYDIPSSRFLRPYMHALRWFESWRIRRILSDMTYAAKQGHLYHLWWHPHNFGKDREKNMAVLKTILDHYRTLQAQYGMRSLHMAEVAEQIAALSV